jgi:hypothetical protein
MKLQEKLLEKLMNYRKMGKIPNKPHQLLVVEYL